MLVLNQILACTKFVRSSGMCVTTTAINGRMARRAGVAAADVFLHIIFSTCRVISLFMHHLFFLFAFDPCSCSLSSASSRFFLWYFIAGRNNPAIVVERSRLYSSIISFFLFIILGSHRYPCRAKSLINPSLTMGQKCA
jgi:hypothetical protein